MSAPRRVDNRSFHISSAPYVVHNPSRGNRCTFRHSSARRPLKDSMWAFSTGFPGRMKSSCTPPAKAQSSEARDVNSVP